MGPGVAGPAVSAGVPGRHWAGSTSVTMSSATQGSAASRAARRLYPPQGGGGPWGADGRHTHRVGGWGRIARRMVLHGIKRGRAGAEIHFMGPNPLMGRLGRVCSRWRYVPVDLTPSESIRSSILLFLQWVFALFFTHGNILCRLWYYCRMMGGRGLLPH